MKLPCSDEAIVDARKVREYLLSTTHPVGRFKAAFFMSLGYSGDAWEELVEDLRSLAVFGDVVNEEETR